MFPSKLAKEATSTFSTRVLKGLRREKQKTCEGRSNPHKLTMKILGEKGSFQKDCLFVLLRPYMTNTQKKKDQRLLY